MTRKRHGIGADIERVERAVIDGATLEYEDAGTGEPVLCIHGALIADTFRPLRPERVLADRYRLIAYHRRGYVGSSSICEPPSLTELAGDCRRLLSRLDVARAHVIGHSLGGAIGLQLALDAPELVHTLSLLEAALVVGETGPQYRQGLTSSMQRFREVGAEAAVHEFLERRWPGYRDQLGDVLPGALEQAVADAATSFETDVPATRDACFGAAEARQITQPVLVVLGEKSTALDPRFEETYRLLLSWLPNAEGFILPGATHFLQVENPRDLARALSDFYARHPFDAAAVG